MLCKERPHWTVPYIRKKREQGENMNKNFLCDFHGKEWARQGKQV
jgi:hypothetical protein